MNTTTPKVTTTYACVGCREKGRLHELAFLDCGDYGRIHFHYDWRCILLLARQMVKAAKAAREKAQSDREWLEG